MQSQTSELIEPRLVKIRAGKRGTGWSVGKSGILTARHVVENFLDGTVEKCLAVPDPRQGAQVFDCEALWSDKNLDLALLAIKDHSLEAWRAAVESGIPAVFAAPGLDPVRVTAIGYPQMVLEDKFPHPEQVPGRLLPVGAAVSRKIPLNVDIDVSDANLIWKGFSGAAVRDETPARRILGVVVDADADFGNRRLYVSPIPDPIIYPKFAAALNKVGAQPILQSANAHIASRLLAVLDEAAHPYKVKQAPNLGMFGVRQARTDINTHGNLYYPYVQRSVDAQLTKALNRRASGDDQRFLLLVGDAMSGKSRSGAHALISHEVVSGLPLFIPRTRADLGDVANLTPPGGAVLWLDDLNVFESGLDAGIIRDYQRHPGLIVVGTLRSDQLHIMQTKLDQRPAWEIVNDDTLVEQVVVPTEWSETEIEGLTSAEPKLREKVEEGWALGEALGAAQELFLQLKNAKPSQKSVVLAVIDWARTGLTTGMPEDYLEQLWLRYLPKRYSSVLYYKSSNELHQELLESIDWARQPIAGTSTALIVRREETYYAEDYLVAHPLREEIPSITWNAALEFAKHAGSPMALFNLAHTAGVYGVNDIARLAYQIGIDTGHPEWSPLSAFNLGVLLHEDKDILGAQKAYHFAIISKHSEWGPAATLNLEALLHEQGELPTVREALREVILMGLKMAAVHNFSDAQLFYQIAIGSGHPDFAPEAACMLGSLYAGLGQRVESQAAYQIAIDSGNVRWVTQAACHLVSLMARTEMNMNQAQKAYETALSCGRDRWVCLTAYIMGRQLEKIGNTVEALEAFRVAACRPDLNRDASEAAFLLGERSLRCGNTDEARRAYQIVSEARHHFWAAKADAALNGLSFK